MRRLKETLGTKAAFLSIMAFSLVWLALFWGLRELFLVGSGWYPPVGVLHLGMVLGMVDALYRGLVPRSLVLRLLTLATLLVVLARALYGNTSEGLPLAAVFCGSLVGASLVGEQVLRRAQAKPPAAAGGELPLHFSLAPLLWLATLAPVYATLSGTVPSPDGAYSARIRVHGDQVSFWIAPRWNALRLDSGFQVSGDPDKVRLEWRDSRHLILHGVDTERRLQYGSVLVVATPSRQP